MPAIEVTDLRKNYGRHVALAGVSFSVDEGEVLGLLGPNGAGKSTAMKILTGFLAPTGGGARVQGHDVLADPIQAQQAIGYLPENAPIYPDMRVGEYLDFVGRIRSLGKASRLRAIERVAQQCGITERLGQLVGELSKGYRQRAGLAQALLHEPAILILDEPTTGLDPNQIVEIRNLIRQIGQHRTVVLSTHILSEVQATCDRVVIINKGLLVADGATADVTAHSQGGILLDLTFAPGTVALPAATIEQALAAIEGVQRVSPRQAPQAEQVSFEVLAQSDVRAEVFKMAVAQGLTLIELAQGKTNLEEVFRRLTLG